MRTDAIKAVITCASLSILLAGCATDAALTGPNGRPMHFIREQSTFLAYKKARVLCENKGYEQVRPLQEQGEFFEMGVECKR